MSKEEYLYRMLFQDGQVAAPRLESPGNGITCYVQTVNLARSMVRVPRKGVLHVIRKAAESKAAVRIWCDVDLGGVRIARSILFAAIGNSSCERCISFSIGVPAIQLRCSLYGNITRVIDGYLSTRTIVRSGGFVFTVAAKALCHAAGDSPRSR